MYTLHTLHICTYVLWWQNPSLLIAVLQLDVWLVILEPFLQFQLPHSIKPLLLLRSRHIIPALCQFHAVARLVLEGAVGGEALAVKILLVAEDLEVADAGVGGLLFEEAALVEKGECGCEAVGDERFLRDGGL